MEKENSGRKKILRNIAWLVLEYVFKMFGALGVSAIVARHLDVGTYGLFQYAVGIILIFSSISFVCGAEVLVPKLVTASKQEVRQIVGSAFFLRLIFSIVALTLLLVYAFVAENKNWMLFALLSPIIILGEPFGVATAWLQSQTNNKPRTILVNIALTIKVGALFVAMHFGGGINSIAAIWLLEAVIISCGLVYILKKEGIWPLAPPKVALIKELWLEGAPFFAAMIIGFVFIRLDMLVLRFFGEGDDIGIYAAAFQMLSSIVAFSPILVNSMAPTFVYKNSNMRAVKINVVRIAGLVVAFALAAGGMAVLLGKHLIPLLFGVRYIDAIPVFNALAWAGVLVFIDAALNVYLIKIKRGNYISIKWIFAIAISAPVYVVYVREVGVLGAVYGYASGYFVACILGVLFLAILKPRATG